MEDDFPGSQPAGTVQVKFSPESTTSPARDCVAVTKSLPGTGVLETLYFCTDGSSVQAPAKKDSARRTIKLKGLDEFMYQLDTKKPEMEFGFLDFSELNNDTESEQVNEGKANFALFSMALGWIIPPINVDCKGLK